MIKTVLTLSIFFSLSVAQTKDDLLKEIDSLKKEILQMKVSKQEKKSLSTQRYRYSNHTFASLARKKLYIKKINRKKGI